MDRTYWSKQSPTEPLFPDILWSRPEHKASAGKLLIIGGNAHGFSAPAEAFNIASDAGAGSVRVLMPDSLQKLVKAFLPEADYAPSTPSGSFAQQALGEFIAASSWADAVLLAGDLGRNAETAILLESYVKKWSGQLTITKDAADYFKESPLDVLKRENTTLVVSLAQLQRIFINGHIITPITHGMDLLHLIEALHEVAQKFPVLLITRHLHNIFVAYGGKVSTTVVDEAQKVWRLKTATRASVFNMQHPGKPFESTTTSLVNQL